MKTATEATTIRRASGRVARALVPVLILLAAVFSLGMVNAQSASALDLTASGETLNSANPFLGGGDQMILAEEADANVGDVTSSACTNTGKGGSTKATNCLPIFRWATGMTMISNVQFTLSQPLDSVSSNLVAKNSITAFMVVGNLLWYIAAFMMDVATNYEIATAIMKPINEFAATIGGALTGSAILGGIVAIGLVTATFSFLRRGFNPKRLLVMVGTLGVLAMMISGSMQDTGSGDDYEPGFGSPAWVAQKSADIFKSIADPVASSVAESADASSDALFSDGAKEDPYSCYTYVEHLYDGYEQNSKGGSQATAIMSRWWMNTSYKTFSMLQYGDESNLGADYATCHQLELKVASPNRHSLVNKEAVVNAGGAEGYAPGADKLPMIPPSSQGKAVQVMNFWGLCAPGGYNDGENFGLRVDIPADRNPEGVIPGGDIGGEFSGTGDKNSCGDFANKPISDGEYSTSWTGAVQSFFKSGENADEFKDIDLYAVGNSNILNDPKEGIASVPELYAFEANLTGADRTVFPGVAAVYAISALFGAIAMTLLALALLVMKTLSYLMAGFLILAVIAGTISQGTGSAVTFFKQWLGYTFITSITNLLMSFVFLMSSALNSLGASIFSAAIPLVLWAGIVPALSIFLLNWMFKKFFKARSPFSMRGMQSYANNPMGVTAAAAGGGALLGDLLDNGRRSVAARGAGAIASGTIDAIGKGKGKGKGGAPGETGATEDSEVIGKAQDAKPGSEDAKSPKDAVGATADSSVDGKDGKDGSTSAPISGDSADTIGQSGESPDTADQSGILPDSLDDDEVIGGSADGMAGAGTLGDRINAFAAGSDDRRQGRRDMVSGAMDSAKYAGLKFAGDISDKAGALRDKLATGASAVAHPRATAKAGLDALKNRWDAGAGTRQALREHPGAAASYLARRSAVNLGKLGKGAVDKVSGMNKKSLLKGAALYGGLGMVTGGLAAPAAVFGAKTLMKHKGAVANGFNSARKSIVAGSKQAYGNYFPGGDEAASEMQFRELNKRIEHAKANGIDGQAGIAADGSDVVGLADDLPLGRERMIDAQRQDAEREFDVFAEEHGRRPDEREMEAIYARHPFANDVRDQSVSASQGELDLGAAAVSDHSNAAAQRGADLPARRVQGGDIDRDVHVEGRDITQKTASVSQTQGADTVSHRRVEVEHDVNTTVHQGADRITQEHTQVNAHTPGQNRVVDDVKHVSSGRGTENIERSSATPSIDRVDKGSYQVGSGAEAASAARRAGLSEDDANIVGQRVEGRSFDPRQMQASAIDVEQGEVTQDRSVFGGQEALDIFGEGDTDG